MHLVVPPVGVDEERPQFGVVEEKDFYFFAQPVEGCLGQLDGKAGVEDLQRVDVDVRVGQPLVAPVEVHVPVGRAVGVGLGAPVGLFG